MQSDHLATSQTPFSLGIFAPDSTFGAGTWAQKFVRLSPIARFKSVVRWIIRYYFLTSAFRQSLVMIGPARNPVRANQLSAFVPLDFLD
jgi:hypothetical protein